MKLITTVFSLFFLLSSLHNPLTGYAKPKPSIESVIDMASNPVKVDQSYFLLPVNTTLGEVVGVEEGKISSLRSIIVSPTSGTWLYFYPLNTTTGFLPVSTDVNIKFDLSSNNEVWQIGPYDKKTKQYFVITGGVEGDVGPKGVGSWFKIEKNGFFYNLRYCPSVCKTCKVLCRKVGIYNDNGVNRLALTNVPFRFMFQG